MIPLKIRAGGSRGKHSEETKRKMSVAQTGKIVSASTREKYSFRSRKYLYAFDNEKEICEKFKELKSLTLLAVQYNCTRQCIKRILNRNNINTKDILKNYVDELNVIKIFKENQSLNKTSRITKCSVWDIKIILTKNNIQFKHDCFKFTKEQEIYICDKYNKFISANEIAKEMNCSVGTITYVLKRYNIKTRGNRKNKGK
jgi:predicted DNA-binding protein YlxM (UPF0122 family)